MSVFAEKAAKYYIFGLNGKLRFEIIKGNGGDVLTMFSSINQHDYSYNREF